jgi:hypothetical protein
MNNDFNPNNILTQEQLQNFDSYMNNMSFNDNKKTPNKLDIKRAIESTIKELNELLI